MYTEQEYAELAAQANSTGKVVFINESGVLELIDNEFFLSHDRFNGEWIRKEIVTEVPQALSRFQALTILRITKLENGTTLYKATDDYINSLNNDTIESITAKTAWETAQEFRRDSTLIQLAQQLFKLTDDQVDDLYIKGSRITA